MGANSFKLMASYRIIDHFYDERKDFIILGLCGRVGSGVSTVSNILQNKFEDLQLPPPGFDNPDIYDAHEYRILYTYAKQNWKPFYRIRTSALIARHILDYTADDFADFLINFHEENSLPEKRDELKAIAQAFFDQPMKCEWHKFGKTLFQNGIETIKAPWKLFESDSSGQELLDQAKQDITTTSYSFTMQLIGGEQISFDCDLENEVCIFKNIEMSKLLKAYANLRHEKSGFQNPFWYLVLEQYLYEFLPAATTQLWNKIHENSPSLPTQALQCMGNNLRLGKKPYFPSTHEEIEKDGYVCLAEDINLAIKVLRAYQLKLQESLPSNGDAKIYNPDDKSLQLRTIIVIDSIKNPYESLYLKARYSNYYLIGIYTENTERRKRLREREHFIDDDIKALDIIEQNTEFKKEIKKYKKALDQGEANKYATPRIIKKMYEQFKSTDLLNNLSYISPFVLQNVSSCLDSADILINNVTDNSAFTYLKRTLLRYVCLIMNPGIVLPTPVERCMQIANTAKLNSGCISRQVGAVLTDDEYHLLSRLIILSMVFMGLFSLFILIFCA